MAEVILGSELALQFKEKIAYKVQQLQQQGKPRPTLAVILVGNHPSSVSYVKGKDKACKEVGFYSRMIHLAQDICEEGLSEVIINLNNDDEVDGILVQMPLPKHLDPLRMISLINPNKDVDGLHPINVGKLYLGLKGFKPCTPLGIIELLKSIHVDFTGLKAVVVGRSYLVGNPLSKLLQDLNCTVTICHSATKNIKEICKTADILVVAIGKAQYVDASFVKEGAIVIDVGINKIDDHLVGDVCFEEVSKVCSYITPVPKGVGPMTIAMLLQNTLDSYYLAKGGIE